MLRARRSSLIPVVLVIESILRRVAAPELYRRRTAAPAAYRRPLKFYLNWVGANLEMCLRAKRVRSKPLEVHIDASGICQLACPVCATGSRIQDRPAGMAKRELAINLLDQIGDSLFSLDLFNWGEPLLNKEVLFAWISAAHAKGIRTRVSSNLSLTLSDLEIGNLVSSGLSVLIVSLDGVSKETYSKYRVNGRFDLVLENLKRIVAEKKRQGVTSPQIVWQFLVFAHNEHEMDAARTMANEIGVDEIRFSAPQVNESVGIDASDDPAYHSGLSRLHQGPAQKSELPSNRERCVWHYMKAAINWNGSMSPCCALYKTKDDLGSVGEAGQHSFAEAYNSPAYRAVRAGGPRGATTDSDLACFRCPAWELRSPKGLNHEILSHIKLRVSQTLLRIYPGLEKSSQPE